MSESSWKWLLIDKLSHGTQYCYIDKGGTELLTLKNADIALSQHRFDVTNVATMLLHHKADLGSLPVISIPFPNFWMEYEAEGPSGRGRFAIRFDASDDRFLSFEVFFETVLGSKIVCRPGFCQLSKDRRVAKCVITLEKDVMEAAIYPALYALALLGCRNSRVCDVVPSRQQARHAQRSSGYALVRYQVITIESGKSRRSGHPSAIIGSQYHQAFHIRRGHFKTYDGKRGLFGNRKGTWWWTPHTAGSIENGVVVSDYSVKTKNNDSRI